MLWSMAWGQPVYFFQWPGVESPWRPERAQPEVIFLVICGAPFPLRKKKIKAFKK